MMVTILSKPPWEVRAGLPSDVFPDREVLSRCGLNGHALYVPIIKTAGHSDMTYVIIWSPAGGWGQFRGFNPHIVPLDGTLEEGIRSILGGEEDLAKEISEKLSDPDGLTVFCGRDG